MRLASIFALAGLSLLLAVSVLAQKGGGAAPTYSKNVKPILDKNCVSCHQGDWAQGGLRLDTPANIQKGGASGKVILAKNSAKSLLFQRVNGDKGRIMPPAGKLKASDLKIIKSWIDSGASFK